MKKLLLVFTFIIIAQEYTFCQSDINNLDGYKYVYVSNLEYQDGTHDKWGIRQTVLKYLKKSRLNILDNNVSEEIKSNPCIAVYCVIEHTANFYSATPEYVTIKFLNCNNETIYLAQGKTGSMVMSFRSGFQNATKRALSDFNYYRFSFDESKTVENYFLANLPEVEKTGETEQSLIDYFNSNSLDEIEGIYKSYRSDHIGHYKIGIKKDGSKYKAIIIESDLDYWNIGEVKAVFEPSSMKGFYSTKWYMGDKKPFETFALMENPALLTVEFKDVETGEKRTDQFIKMYPTADIYASNSNEGLKAAGSGFIISTEGVIATNAHVIEDADRIEIYLNNEFGTKKYSAYVLLKDESNDVALLKIDDDEFMGFNSLPYSISQTTDIGEDVFTIGYPLNSLMGDNFKVTNGIISSNSGLKDDVRFIQITTPIQPGNSGGPLFNKDGNVVALTTSRLNERAVGTSIENVNYAIKATYLINIYNMLPNKEQLSKNSTLSNQDLKDQVKVLKNYVCLIKVY